jgi:hypothetical protein
MLYTLRRRQLLATAWTQRSRRMAWQHLQQQQQLSWRRRRSRWESPRRARSQRHRVPLHRPPPQRCCRRPPPALLLPPLRGGVGPCGCPACCRRRQQMQAPWEMGMA